MHSAEELDALKKRLLDPRAHLIRDRQATIQAFKRTLTDRMESLRRTLALVEALEAEAERHADTDHATVGPEGTDRGIGWDAP